MPTSGTAVNESMILTDLVLITDTAEWPMITLTVRQGDHVCRSEAWDQHGYQAALARFDELTGREEHAGGVIGGSGLDLPVERTMRDSMVARA